METSPTLRDYQVQDIETITSMLKENRSVFVLHEQRVGKLIELLGVLKQAWDRTRSQDADFNICYVGPLSTLFNVQLEAEKWNGWHVNVNPDLPVWGCDVIEERQPLFVAFNYAKLRQDKKWWAFRMKWTVVIFDECHNLSNRNSEQTKGAKRLNRRADRAILMSGTPIANGLPRELWPILHLAEPKEWSSFWKYMQEYAVGRPGWGLQPQDEDAPFKPGSKARLAKWVFARGIRRTQAEIEGMARIKDVVVRVALSGEHRTMYRELQRTWSTEVRGTDTTVISPSILALASRLRQMAASPQILDPAADEGDKVRAIVAWLNANRLVWHKVVIFCWHKGMVNAVASAIHREYEPHDRIWVPTGADTVAVRQASAAGFQAHRGQGFFITTIGAMAEGISLDTADTLLFAEESWVPKDNDQARSRILGENQRGKPLCVRFRTTGTIEEHIADVVGTKRGAADGFLALRKLIRLTKNGSAV